MIINSMQNGARRKCSLSLKFLEIQEKVIIKVMLFIIDGLYSVYFTPNFKIFIYRKE